MISHISDHIVTCELIYCRTDMIHELMAYRRTFYDYICIWAHTFYQYQNMWAHGMWENILWLDSQVSSYIWWLWSMVSYCIVQHISWLSLHGPLYTLYMAIQMALLRYSNNKVYLISIMEGSKTLDFVISIYVYFPTSICMMFELE